MALPAGITPKTVTIGIASFFDGSLADGTATITAPVNVVHTPTNRPIFSSTMSQKFVDGVASFSLAPTDAPGLNRVDWTYKLNVAINGALVQPDPVYFTLTSAGPDTVDLDSLVTVPSSAGVPVSATIVTSVNGQTGDVTVTGGTGGAAPDATSTVKGIVKLAGDLAGTAAAPTVPGLAAKVNTASLAAVATSGAYTDLSAKPTIPTVGAAGAGAAVALSSTDASVTNARTPSAHAASHATGAADPITPAAIGAVGLSATGVPDPSAVYEPAHRTAAPRPQPVAVLTEFQSGHGFTASAGTLTADTSVSVKGSQSALLVTDGTGAYNNVTSPTLASFDLTGKILRVTFRIEDVARIGGSGVQVQVGADATFASGWSWTIQSSNTLAQNVAYSGEWVAITLPFHDASKLGAGAKTGLTALRFQIKDNGTAATVRLQGAETIADGTGTFPNGVVVLCADDGYASFMASGKAYCDAYGYPVTYYPIVDMLGKTGRTTVQALTDAQKLGAEVGAHSYADTTHTASYTGMTAAALDADLRQNKAWLIANGFRGSSHSAFPKGQDGLTTDGVPVRSIVSRYFATARSTSQKLKETFPVADPLRIRAISSITSFAGGYSPTSLTQVGGDLDKCKTNGTVLALTFHEIVADGTQASGNQCGVTEFQSIIDGIRSRGIPVLTIGELLRTPLGVPLAGGAAVETVTVPKREAPTPSAGAATTASASDHVHPRAYWAPEDHGLVTWSFDPACAPSTQTPASGVLQVTRVHIPVASTVTNVLLQLTTAGTGLTAGQSFAALYSAAGALLGQSADQSTAWASGGLKTVALTTPVAVATGDYYVAFYSVGTTPPTFLRGSGYPVVNAGLSNANSRFATANTGLTTAPPATLGTLAGVSAAYWVGLS